MGADNESGQTLGGASDFNFIIGDWDVYLKKLVSPLTGSTIAILKDTCGNFIQISQLDRPGA
jgi:hypothetical protein